MERLSQEEVIPFIPKIEELDLVDEAELLYSPPPLPWTATRIADIITASCKELVLAFPWLLRLVLQIFLPSYLQRRDPNIEVPPVRSTAYLDSLRGVAALLVVIHHWTYVAWNQSEGWRGGEDPKLNRYLTQLPIIRLLHTGAPMVAIFFIISGYVLSIKPLKLARALKDGDANSNSLTSQRLLQTVSASLVRRWFRLFVPVIISTLICIAMLQLGWYATTRKMSEDIKILSGEWEEQVIRKDNLWEEMKRWVREMMTFMHHYNASPKYDEHLWTIAVEWQCSLRLYFTLLVSSCMKSRMRLTFLLFLIAWAWGWGHWELCEFWCGAVMAEAQLKRDEKRDDPPKAASETRLGKLRARLRRRAPLWWSLNLFAGLWLMSYPPVRRDLALRTPGYMTLAKILPATINPDGKSVWADQYRLWHAIGAMQCMWSLGSLHCLRNIFSSRLFIYFGDISYSLYIVHGPIFHVLGYNMTRWFWNHVTGHTPKSAYSAGVILGALPTFPVVLYVADRFRDSVDAPSIRLSKWIQRKVIPMEVVTRESESTVAGSAPCLSSASTLRHP